LTVCSPSRGSERGWAPGRKLLSKDLTWDRRAEKVSAFLEARLCAAASPVQRSLYKQHRKTDQRGDDRRRPGADRRGQIADLSRHGEQPVRNQIEKAATTGIEQGEPFRVRPRREEGERQREQQHHDRRQRLGRRAVEPRREQAFALAGRCSQIERPPGCRQGTRILPWRRRRQHRTAEAASPMAGARPGSVRAAPNPA
jgi:hypothetical protein